MGRFREFSAFRASHKGPRALGPRKVPERAAEKDSKTFSGPGPGPGPWACAQGPGPGPWACVQGPGPWARALAQGPKSEKCKMAKSTSEEKMQPRTFRMARIDPSRQGVMNERSFVHGDLYFCPKNAEKVQKRLQTTKNPIPPSIHPYFFL